MATGNSFGNDILYIDFVNIFLKTYLVHKFCYCDFEKKLEHKLEVFVGSVSKTYLVLTSYILEMNRGIVTYKIIYSFSMPL
jgi:hypothetical protein